MLIMIKIIVGKTRGAVPRTIAAGAAAGRDDDRATDRGDAQLSHWAHWDAAFLPAHVHAKGNLGTQRRALHRFTGTHPTYCRLELILPAHCTIESALLSIIYCDTKTSEWRSALFLNIRLNFAVNYIKNNRRIWNWRRCFVRSWRQALYVIDSSLTDASFILSHLIRSGSLDNLPLLTTHVVKI